ncbi:RraA family protein [Arthrobacter pigmenti]
MSTVLVYDDTEPLDDNILRRSANLPTAAVSDAMQRFGGAVGLRPITTAAKPTSGLLHLVGPAATVQTRPGDNLVVHKAVDLAKPGDVLVIDAGGQNDRAIVGGLLVSYAKSRGVAGIVLDGAARDLTELVELEFPVFARGISHLGPYKNGPGVIRGQVAVGGTAVGHGDLVIGDEDGVVFVPRLRMAEVLTAAEAVVENERKITEAIATDSWDRSWVAESLHIEHITKHTATENHYEYTTDPRVPTRG